MASKSTTKFQIASLSEFRSFKGRAVHSSASGGTFRISAAMRQGGLDAPTGPALDIENAINDQLTNSTSLIDATKMG